MNNDKHANLDEALASLPSDVEPSRDLWPQIRSGIQAESGKSTRAPFYSLSGQLAAGAVLMIATAATTYLITRHSMQAEFAAASSVSAPANADSSFDAKLLGADYMRARADLDRLFAERIATLPSATRAKLQSNLAELRHAADEIAATLAEHPSDSLLQELLISTRQRELQLLADVGQMPIPNS